MFANESLGSLRSECVKFHPVLAAFSGNAVTIKALILFIDFFAERYRNRSAFTDVSFFLCDAALFGAFLVWRLVLFRCLAGKELQRELIACQCKRQRDDWNEFLKQCSEPFLLP